MAPGSVAASRENSVSAAEASQPPELVAASRPRAIGLMWRVGRWNPLSRLWPDAAPRMQPSAPPATHDSLMLFAPEASAAPKRGAARVDSRSAARMRQAVAWLFFFVTAAAGTVAVTYAVYKREASRPIGQSEPARLTVNSRPSGAEVIVDGEARGVTPLTMKVTAGAHTIRVARSGETKVLPIQVAAGAEIAQYVDFPDPSVTEPFPGRTSAVSVITDPAGARVTIDGELRGVSPLNLADLAPGAHVIAVTGINGSVERSVSTKSGITTSVVFSLARTPTASGSGWLAVVAPFEVSLREQDDLVGTSRVSKIMMPAGRHTLNLSNDRLEYHESRDIDIVPGKTSVVNVDVSGELNLNARPWADVQVDGRPIGQTPLARVPVAVGSHQVVFTHPQFGERQITIDVKANVPNRVAVDLTTAAER